MSYTPKSKHAKHLTLACVVLTLVTIGCRTSTWSSKNITGDTGVANGGELANPLASVAPADATAGATANGAAGTQPPTTQPTETPQQVMADVRELGAVNPAAQAALMQELEKADPDIWPDVVQNFRSRLAYGDRLYTEERLAANQNRPNQTPQQQVPQQQIPQYGPQYANGNPYYANQPILANENAYQTTPYQATGQATPSPAYPQQPYTPQQSNPYPSNTQPNQIPQSFVPLHDSAPLPLPSSPSQPAPVYPQSSMSRTASKVIQASYETPVEETSLDAADQRFEDEEESDLATAAKNKVKNTAKESTANLDWEASLTASIESLQKKLESNQENDRDDDESKLDQLRLRFMLLAAGRSTEATEPISDESEAMTDFWAGQMFGLGTLLDERKASNPTRRNALAKHKLSEALQHLGKASDLAVRNLSFCRAVTGFANIEQFEKYEFSPNEEVILYAELDNLKHEETVDGYRTSLKIGYKIFDSADHLIEDQQSNSNEECSSVLRRDFYISQRIRLPERLYPGRHILKLTVEDIAGQKYGESIVKFDVK